MDAQAEFTVICCPDSFKGTATAREAAEAAGFTKAQR